MSSASRCSDAAVKPTRSTKRTETRRRSATGPDAESWRPFPETVGASAVADLVSATSPAAARELPHSPQNFAPAGLTVPHTGQVAASRAPHSTQNLRPSSFAVPQLAQVSTVPGLASPTRRLFDRAAYGPAVPSAHAGAASARLVVTDAYPGYVYYRERSGRRIPVLVVEPSEAIASASAPE